MATIENLRFKSKTVVALEEKHKKSIMEFLEPSISNLHTLYMCATGVKADEAYDAIDEILFEEDVDLIELTKMFAKALQKCGFFPKQMNVDTMFDRVNVAMNALQEQQVQIPQIVQPVAMKETL